MRYITNKDEIQMDRDTVVTLGKFDGFHIGHQLLIKEVLSSKKQGLYSVVFTFSLLERLRDDVDKGNLLTEDEKIAYLTEQGIDAMVSYPFDDEVRCMTAETFIEKVLCERLHVKKIVVGNDYAFGYQRKGNVKLLQRYASRYGYEVCVFDKVTLDNQVVSSSTIRNELKQGHIETVNRMLGRQYCIDGTVVYGNQIGRTLSMPTANIYPADDKLLPPNGVYVTIVDTDYGKYKAITNIGFKPTVGGETKPGVESYLFDFDEDLYGKNIKVRFYTFERKEQKFSGLPELKEQMFRDKEFARNYVIL